MTTDTRYSDDFRLTHVLTDQASAITLAHSSVQDPIVDSGPDLTPVTDAGHAVEDMIRSQLVHTRSRDSVVGEERGTSGHASRQWIIDPTDGMKGFVRGVPAWATLIGLVEDGEVVMGVVSVPALKRRWWTAKGQGSFAGTPLFKGHELSVFPMAGLSDASLSYSSSGS